MDEQHDETTALEAGRSVCIVIKAGLSRSSRDEPGPYGFLPFLRKDHTIKAWDQTPKLTGWSKARMLVAADGTLQRR